MPGSAAVETWSAGDYRHIAVWLPIVSEQLCESAELRPGWSVLDVAAGTGNAALAAARRGCLATGLDCVPALIARARRRARAEGLPVRFDVAFAENIPFADATFDAVLSTFGVMFSTDHRRAAQELLRVCRPDGIFALANWTPAGFIGEYFRTCLPYAGARPASNPIRWGDETYATMLLSTGASRIEFHKRIFWFRHHSAESWVEHMGKWYGPTVRLMTSGIDSGMLTRDLLAIARAFNEARDGSFAAPAEYVEVIGRRA